nr:MAG TPA: protein of unknown function DUF1858 [Bacteriophage sp.]
MANPLFTQAMQQAVGQNPIAQLYGMFRNSQNPQAMLSQLAKNNPQMAQVMQMCNGRNPQQVFYEMCQRQGVDPNSILSQFK